MKRSATLPVVVGAIAVLVLGACSGSGDGQSSSESAEGGESGKVTVWTLTNEPGQAEAWNAMIEGFNAKYPDIEVITEERATDAHKDALRQAAGTDANPDIYRYWGGPGLGGELVKVGSSADISSLYEEYGWEDIVSPPTLASVTQYGGHHGVPFIQANEAVFYNKELFEKAGITSPPTSYEEWTEAADKLVAVGITPMEFGGTVNWHVMRLLDNLIETACGAEAADELTTADGNWAGEPCVTEAFTELKRWGDNYLNEGFMGLSNDDSSQLFYNGQAAMTIEGDWFAPMAVAGGLDAEKIGIFPLPTGTGRAYGFGELMYVTPRGAENPAVGAFLDFILSSEGQELLGSAFSTISVNPNVEAKEGTLLAEEWAAIIANADGLHINNDQNFSTAETTEFWRIQNAVLTGSIAPAQAGVEFQTWREANGD